jgi:hypothetical protein
MLTHYLEKLGDRHRPLRPLHYPTILLRNMGIKLCIYHSWTSRTSHSRHDHSRAWNHALVLVLKTKLWVSSGWMISSKLQRHHELCWFTQALLKMKFTRWKTRFPSLKISKEVPFVTFFWMDGVLLEVRNREVDVALGVSLLRHVVSWLYA